MNVSRTATENLNCQINLLKCLSEIFWTTPRSGIIASLRTLLEKSNLLENNQRIVVCIDGLNTEEYQKIAVDYVDLFCGFDAKAPFPYESIFLGEQRLLMQAPYLQVKKVYAKNEFSPGPGDGNEPLDHISHELRYLCFLLERAIKALQQGDAPKADELIAKKDEFVKEHLQLWVPSFCREVKEKASTAFFRELSGLLEKTVVNWL